MAEFSYTITIFVFRKHYWNINKSKIPKFFFPLNRRGNINRTNHQNRNERCFISNTIEITQKDNN